jgi:hypothetical protein
MYRTKIVLEKFEFGAKPGGVANGENFSPSQKAPQKVSSVKEAPANNDSINYPEEDINPEDIPF